MTVSVARQQAIVDARRILDYQPVFLDTETTGIDRDAEIVEVALVDTDGRVMLNTRVKPTKLISSGAQAVHHISDADVASCPAFNDVLSVLAELLDGRHVVAYNEAFDSRMFVSSARLRDITMTIKPDRWHCAMLLYARFYGEWNSQRRSYRWQKLGVALAQCGIDTSDIVGSAHGAAYDAEATRRVLLHVAAQAEK